MPRARKRKEVESPASEAQAIAEKLDLPTADMIPDPKLPDLDRPAIQVYTPDESLPAFPVQLREKFPHPPMGFEARGTFEAAGVRVTRDGNGESALQFKDGAAMSREEKSALQDKGYRYVPGDKQWANPQASWADKINDARALSESRLKDRDR